MKNKIYVSFLIPTRFRTKHLLKSLISIEKNTPKNINVIDLTKQEVHDLVFNDFTYWFKPVAGDKEKYKELSDALYNWMLKTDLPQKFNT